MRKQTQLSLIKTNWKYRLAHGGSLRNSKIGRGARPLSTKHPLHLVFKINRASVRGGLLSPQNFALLHRLIRKYSFKFFIKVEQFSIQSDHVHLLIRAPRRACFQSYFRVLAGQFAQIVTDTLASRRYGGVSLASRRGPKIWKYRPFSRVVKGFKALRVVRNYIQLNDREAQGQAYRKNRLRGLSEEQLRELWT